MKVRLPILLLIVVGSICVIARTLMRSEVRTVSAYSGQSEKGMQKQMTPDEMVQVLLKAKEMGLADKLPEDPDQLQELAKQLAAQSVYSKAPPGAPVTGMQQLVLTPPIGDPEKSLMLLPSYFEGPEWSAIFQDQLQCSYVDEDLPIEEWRAKQEVYFRQSLPEYPMLARIWDTYVDVEYRADEVAQLKSECSELLHKSNNTIARSGLQKLISASEEALNKGMGLSLLAD